MWAVSSGAVIPSDPIETKGVQLQQLALTLREHPVAVAAEWAVAAPRAALRTVTLDAMGEQPTVLGDACVAALREAVSLL